VLNVQPEDGVSETRFSNLVHWPTARAGEAYGGLLESAGLSGTAATVAHLALVWGSEQVILPSLNVSAPAFKYGGKATATDLWRHGVCVTATGVAYSYLDRCQFPLVGGRSRRGSSSSILRSRA
jgi:hypothetical protein